MKHVQLAVGPSTDSKMDISPDYILVWEVDAAASGHVSVDQQSSRDEAWRVAFEDNIREAGVNTQEEVSVTSKKRIHFLKLFISWETMCHYAEQLKFRVPIVPYTRIRPRGSTVNVGYRNPMKQTVPNRPSLDCTCCFTRAEMFKFPGVQDKSSFFKPTQRHRVAYEILATRVFGREELGEVGVNQLIELGVYTTAYPLHEGSYQLPVSESDYMYSDNDLNRRQILQKYWASWGRWYKFQPLDHVREYLGENIAFYFAWLGLYTSWLIPAAIVGFCVFLVGCGSASSDVPTTEACNSGMNYTMCPMCAGCEVWYLSEACFTMRVARVFDHHGILFYSAFLVLWAVLFLEYWKRRNAVLAHRWSVTNLRVEADRPRPGYVLRCTEFRRNTVTGQLEPHFPHWRRILRYIASLVCLLCMLIIVLLSIYLTIACEAIITHHIHRTKLLQSLISVAPLGAIVGAIIQLIVLLIMEHLYERLAYALNEWETHRTKADFEGWLVIKMFIFQIFNYYFSLFYVAFIKGNKPNAMGQYTNVFGYRQEDCSKGGCILDLVIQLAIVMVGKQAIRNFLDLVLPSLILKLREYTKGLRVATGQAQADADTTPWESDYALIEHDTLQSDYLKMVLQFGFVTVFGAIFPLAPLFALVNNVAAIRLDAKKLVCNTRRPLYERAEGIGVWLSLLQFITYMSIITNIGITMYQSDALPRSFYQHSTKSDLHGYMHGKLAPIVQDNDTSKACFYMDENNAVLEQFGCMRYLIAITTENVMLFACYILSEAVPDVPKSVLDSVMRENHLVSRALAANRP